MKRPARAGRVSPMGSGAWAGWGPVTPRVRSRHRSHA
jgi:hypothetical protein